MKKQTMSAAFFCLLVFAILSMTDVIGHLTRISLLLQGFTLPGLLGYLITLVELLAPIALLVLLYLNTKRDVKPFAWIFLLVYGCLKAYAIFGFLRSLPMFLGSGADFFSIMPGLSGLVMDVLACILLFVGMAAVKNGKKPKLVTIALVLGFLYMIPAGTSVLIGMGSPLGIVKDLFMVMALCVLPATLIDRSTAPAMNNGFIRTIAWALVLVMIILGLSALLTDNSEQKAGGTSECRYCHREFSDSGNKRSIARTGMCSNCAGNYEDLSDWLDEMEN